MRRTEPGLKEVCARSQHERPSFRDMELVKTRDPYRACTQVSYALTALEGIGYDQSAKTGGVKDGAN